MPEHTMDLRVAQLVKELDACTIIPPLTRAGLQDDLQECIDINGDPDERLQRSKRQLLASTRNCIHFYRFIEELNESHARKCAMNPLNWDVDDAGKPTAPWNDDIKSALAEYASKMPLVSSTTTTTTTDGQTSTVSLFGLTGKPILAFGGKAASLVAVPCVIGFFFLTTVIGVAWYIKKSTIDDIKEIVATASADIRDSQGD